MSRRTERVNVVLRQEISQIIGRQIKDPRLSGLVTITRVETSEDLRHARVFVSVLVSKDDKGTVLRGLNSATGYMRRELKGRLTLKYIPDLSIVLDESLEEADHIFRLMDSLSPESPGGPDGPAVRGQKPPVAEET